MAIFKTSADHIKENQSFIAAMNRAIKECSGYEEGMEVAFDGASGYCLKVKNKKVNSVEHMGLLSQASKLVRKNSENKY